ncbi:MAG: hypothetical protein A2664_01130 [Candidatus Taylorbacteria bacterium RIFCSPHIGHO2_01_FULL_46_22b]|uniref:Type II secretion system protein GspG C-terminal domain-containing protein n=1 Tax=Candidatus Taylorbacteria bacterium RIFCSPHIGHO2_01_FULL_46_22b TaxID=1802301 RepID=A0A1G2M4B0_9BACT|nr:MAG: hypothetical protein A2664_01130 [Candidatus Taylorbacteria bacterium RIFCSPHIGHO2_01_FULL_46_22b]
MGSVIVINGVSANVDDIITDAHRAVNGANLHQLATVIELYYSDNGYYPNASGGEELINLFERDGYIMNRPLDPSVFEYIALENGQNYRLTKTY